MFIGDTSACTKASGLPFIGTGKIADIQVSPLTELAANHLRTDRNPLNSCADCGQLRLVIRIPVGV